MKDINDELTYKIIGSTMKVHNTLGNACRSKGSTARRQEVIYQRYHAIEMEKQCIQFLREQEMPIYYEDRVVGKRRADFIVENTVLIELKAVIKLEDVHLAQGHTYLQAYTIEKGLLIYFGAPCLEVKRLFRQQKQLINDLTQSNPNHP